MVILGNAYPNVFRRHRGEGFTPEEKAAAMPYAAMNPKFFALVASDKISGTREQIASLVFTYGNI